MLAQRGGSARLLEVPEAPLVVYGEINTPGATRTLIFYAHYDRRPVEPAKWAGGDPFKPVLRSASLEAGGKEIPLLTKGEQFDPEWRLHARSTSADKAPIMRLRAAFDALRARRLAPTSNIRLPAGQAKRWLRNCSRLRI